MRSITLVTKNEKKLEAYQKQFSLYGIQVNRSEKKEESIKDMKSAENVLAVIWDTSELYNMETGEVSEKNSDMELVYNQTKLTYVTKETTKEIKSKKTYGFIDLSRKEGDSNWWDDIFVVSKLGKTYKDLNLNNNKISGREQLISEFILSELYYKDKIDLNFNPQNQSRTIEFDGKSVDFIKENTYLNSPSNTQFKNLFNAALNNGAFFRSAKNRREKNYWIPGLNAGIPLVPKKDDVHEITFAVHDLCHFIIPDLVFDGRSGEWHRRTYIVHRMMSEAITMVLADMVFIDGLKEDGVEYDFSKRKIYPLYEKIKHHDLMDILHANVVYCLKGDDSEYKALLNNKNLEVLEGFKEKYMPFFVEDYKWTIKNYENMASNSDFFGDWSQDLSETIKKVGLKTISGFKKNLQKGDLIESVFKEVTKDIFALIKGLQLKNTTKEENVSNSFKKYMLGQMFIFYKYDFVPSSKPYKEKIKEYVSKEFLNSEDMEKIRNLYESYLVTIFDLNLITADDFETYKETFPIFDSFFVFYDKEKSYYDSLEGIYNKEIN